MAKKTTKKTLLNQEQQEIEKTNKSLSSLSNKKIEESLKDFSKLSEKERTDLFWSKDFFEQFRSYFKKQHPNLLDEIDSEDKLTIYVQNLEKKGFSIRNITQSKIFQKEMKETTNEKQTIIDSLKQLQEYCSDWENKMPANIFEDFAKEINLKTSPRLEILSTTKITKIGNLFTLWKKFLEDNNITLKEYQKDYAEKTMNPNLLPTERLLISASIKKIKKNLPASLLSDFTTRFPLPIDIHSPFENLRNFKNERDLFVDAHSTEIDEKLEKKLNNIIVTNADIYKEFEFEGEDINWTKWFSQQTKNFRKMFNKLVTRQIFEEAKEVGSYIENQLEEIGNNFRSFPPYFNELFNIYPYRHKEVIKWQPDFEVKYEQQSKILQQKENELNSPKPETEKNKTTQQRRNEKLQEVIKEKENLNSIKRKAYANSIEKKESWIGNIIEKLIDSKFDMNKISKENQQKIINILINKKLEDNIQNQIPNVLWIDPTEYKTFINNLFDLNQSDISIPTQYGDIPIHFLEKKFVGWPTQESMEIDSSGNVITEQKNLPLNFKVQITEQNKDFFENNIVFGNLFSNFQSKKWPIKLNDSYKVSIKNPDWKIIEWYLSEYPPTEDIQNEIDNNNNMEWWRYLYSHPITQPEDARKIMTWDEEGRNPVVIPIKNEADYEIDIVSKELNLNDEAIWWLLFSETLGKYNIKKELDANQEKKLAAKFWPIKKENIYYDKNFMTDIEEKDYESETTGETSEDLKEKDYQEFLSERQSLKGYQEKPENEKSDYGFKNWSKLLIQTVESKFPPSGAYMYMTAEIRNIDKKKWTYDVVYKGNEASLWTYEGKSETHKLTKNSLQNFKERFEENKIYKLPDNETNNDINKLLPILQNIWIDNINPDESFKWCHRKGDDFVINTGKEEGKSVTHFGLIETIPGENQDEESKIGYMYEIKHNPDKKSFTLTANDKEKTKITLDYPNFALFIANRKLQPKTEESSKGIDPKPIDGPTIAQPKKRNMYSFASIIWLFKNFGKKIGDGLKKYEEDQVEKLTESMFYQGKLFDKIAKFMPTEKLKTAFSNAWVEYMAERDNKIWKKIETYLKFYEGDPDFWGDYMRGKNIKPLLEGEVPFKDHQQAAAILMATIKKGKWPYSRNTDRAWKWKRVKILLGENHQKRYLMMKEKLQRELEQGYNIHWQVWADDLQNEILQLEMKYIVHCIDGRQLADRGDVERLEATFSKKYAGELEWAANKFFSESVSGSSKEKSYSFELARFEYFRLLADRPQQAIPCLKQIAAKAVTPSQRKVFEWAVITGMLSGAFYNITQEDKSFIQKICRTIGFLPGMWIKNPNHHQKIEQFIKVATGEMPVYETKSGATKYNNEIFWFWKWEGLEQYKKIADYNKWINGWLSKKNHLEQISKFAAMSGKNYQDKTLIELLNDPKTPIETKQLLQEIEARSLEKDESVDPDVKMNGYGLEQNILAKNQSLIDEITDFHDGKFKGKDKDEIQGIQTARNKISQEIPRNEIKDDNQIIYILKKFMNWFEWRWFNTEEKKFLIRALLTVQEEFKKGNNESANEILRYMIVGNVVKNSGNGQAPNELINGLEAFKEFFKSNLNSILQPHIIEKGINGMFVEELSKGPYKVASWEEYADLEENKIFFWSKEENKRRSENRKKYNIDQIYINKKMYMLARQIEQRNHIGNKFKEHINTEQKSTSEKLHYTLKQNDIRIKNPEVIEKVKRKLSWELWQEDMSDEDLAAMMGNEDNYYGWF